MQSPLQRIYKLKIILLGLLSAVTGIALMVLAKFLAHRPGFSWISDLPVFEVGSTLFVTGAFAVAYNYLDGRDKEVRDDERLRRLLAESAPAFRDAVVAGFAAGTEDLSRVATPELLDNLATNALTLRLGDEQFAREIYQDVRDQAIRATERWYDVGVSIRLSSAEERGTSGALRFDVLVEWEYTVTPTHPVQRFACVSDREEFRDLASDVPATLTWFMTPRPGFDASSRDSYELLQFSVDGEKRTIRRSTRKSGQVYSAAIGAEVMRAGKPVRIRHLYRVVTPQSGHCLFIEVPVPAKDVRLSLDYTAATISRLVVTDLVATGRPTVVSQLPADVPGRVLMVDVPGWLMPRAGLTFVWTLTSEDPAPAEPGGTNPPRPEPDVVLG